MEGRARDQRDDGRRGPVAAPVPRHPRPGEAAAAADWIRSQQRADGTWATFHGGPADLSTTVEAYVALRLAGDAGDAAHMAQARRFVLDAGGIERTRVFTRIWLALFGQWSWDDLPALPPEVILLPTWVPLNVYDFACWARQTIVPLTVVAAHRPVRPLPFSLDELRRSARQDPPNGRAVRGGSGGSSASTGCSRATSACPLGSAQGVPAARWPSGWRSSGSSAARRPTARGAASSRRGCTRCSRCTCSATRSTIPYGRRPRAGLDRFTIHDGAAAGSRRASRRCGTPRSRSSRCRRGRGARPSGARAGGPSGCWARRSRARRLGGAPPAPAPGRLGVRVRQRQLPRRRRHRRGGAGAAAGRRPRRDPPPASRRARRRLGRGHAVPRRRLGGVRRRQHQPAVARRCRSATSARSSIRRRPTSPPTRSRCWPASRTRTPAGSARRVAWLRAEQEPGGSWFGRWGANHVYGTGAAVPALVAAGVVPSDPSIARAVTWLERHQNDDGGWGEDLRSYDDPDAVGRGTSTASQTAWALLALLAAGRHDSEPGAPRHRVPGRHPAARRHLGRGPVHRHRLPGRLLHQLPPVPARVPADGARPLLRRRRRCVGSAAARDRPDAPPGRGAGGGGRCAGVGDDRHRRGARAVPAFGDQPGRPLPGRPGHGHRRLVGSAAARPGARRRGGRHRGAGTVRNACRSRRPRSSPAPWLGPACGSTRAR